MPKCLIDLREDRPLLDIVSYGLRGPGRTGRLSPAQVEQVARTVRHVPEVMVKVSGGGTSAKAVAAHFKYIDRRGELVIETDEGTELRGRGVERNIVADWDLDADEAQSRSPYGGQPGRKPAKLVHNIILSMPAGTPPAGLLAASRAFAREQFALKHRYAMALHTDQGHPHVHLVVKVMSEQCQRLNIRKATLREWRQEFARHLRKQGISANATNRVVRGATSSRKRDGIYRAMLRGDSTHVRERTEAVARELLKGDMIAEPGKSKLLNTRRAVERGWLAVRQIIASDGQSELAREVRKFIEQMPPPRTEKESIAEQLIHQTQRIETRQLGC